MIRQMTIEEIFLSQTWYRHDELWLDKSAHMLRSFVSSMSEEERTDERRIYHRATNSNMFRSISMHRRSEIKQKNFLLLNNYPNDLIDETQILSEMKMCQWIERIDFDWPKTKNDKIMNKTNLLLLPAKFGNSRVKQRLTDIVNRCLTRFERVGHGQKKKSTSTFAFFQLLGTFTIIDRFIDLPTNSFNKLNKDFSIDQIEERRSLLVSSPIVECRLSIVTHRRKRIE